MFFENFNNQFAQFKKERSKGKGAKAFKALSTEKKAKLFLDQSGPELKKQFKQSVEAGEKINFSGLPNSVQNYLGKKEAAKIKREQLFPKGGKLRLNFLSGPNFAFNEDNQLKKIQNQLKNENFAGLAFVVDKTDETELTVDEAAQIFRAGSTDENKGFRNIKRAFKILNEFEDVGKYPFWSAYALFEPGGKYSIFLTINKDTRGA